MAMVPAAIGKIVEAKILAGLSAEFADMAAGNPDAIKSWQKQAKIAGMIAEAIVEQILLTAQVAPGIATAGSPTAQVTVAPGIII